MAYLWQRAYGFFNRFGTLRRVELAFKGLQPGTYTSRRLFGYTMVLDLARSTAQQLLMVEGERFVEERHLLRRLLRPGMTVVDVGANIGYYLLLLQRQIGANGRVVCIEPSDENLPELRRTIAANDFKNVDLHAVALGDHDGETGLQAGINSGIVDGQQGPYTVPLRRLDALVNERVDFLKIDVEGYEGQVLGGAEALLAASKPTLFLELHPHIVGRFGHSVRDILDSLARHYKDIVLYEKTPAAAQTVFDKIATRYLGRDPLRTVLNPDSYVRKYDEAGVAHTYWAVCRP